MYRIEMSETNFTNLNNNDARSVTCNCFRSAHIIRLKLVVPDVNISLVSKNVIAIITFSFNNCCEVNCYLTFKMSVILRDEFWVNSFIISSTDIFLINQRISNLYLYSNNSQNSHSWSINFNFSINLTTNLPGHNCSFF